MSARFRVTILDRENGSAQGYDVDHIMAMLCIDEPNGETWWTVLKGINNEGIATGLATLIDRVRDVAGEEVVMSAINQIGRKPKSVRIIDFSGEREK